MIDYLKRLVSAIASMRVEVRFEDAGRRTGKGTVPKGTHPQAQFEIIGLDAVRREYIAHWPSIHQRVHQIVQMIIRQNLQPGEDFRLVARDSYAISFHRDAESAHRCAANIRAAVMDLFIFDLKIKNIGFQMSMHNGHGEHPEHPANFLNPPKKVFIRPSVEATHVVGAERHQRSDNAERPLLMRDDDGRGILPHGI